MINRSVSPPQIEPRPDSRLDVPDRLLHRVRHHVVVVGGMFGERDAGRDGGCGSSED